MPIRIPLQQLAFQRPLRLVIERQQTTGVAHQDLAIAR
jgi:hypothetical protein